MFLRKKNGSLFSHIGKLMTVCNHLVATALLVLKMFPLQTKSAIIRYSSLPSLALKNEDHHCINIILSLSLATECIKSCEMKPVVPKVVD